MPQILIEGKSEKFKLLCFFFFLLGIIAKLCNKQLHYVVDFMILKVNFRCTEMQFSFTVLSRYSVFLNSSETKMFSSFDSGVADKLHNILEDLWFSSFCHFTNVILKFT